MMNISRDLGLFKRIFKKSKYFSESQKYYSYRITKTFSFKCTSKQRNIMERAFFGALLETKKEKNRRSHLENLLSISKREVNENYSANPELSWVQQKASKMTLLNVTKTNKIPSITITKVLRIKKIDTKNENEYKERNDNDNNDNWNNEIGIVKKPQVPEVTFFKNKPKVSLPKVLVQYLPQFPLFQKVKSCNVETSTKAREIISISPNEDKDCLKYPSVTRILSATMSDQAKALLDRWKESKIAELGIEGFQIYQADLFSNGKLFHEAILCKLTNKSFDVPEQIEKSLKSLENIFPELDSVKAIESHVIHPQLLYRGIVDCVAIYRGELCLIDWKKSDKKKSRIQSTYDAPIQVASYIGALNCDEKYPFQINRGTVVVAYTNGDPATVHEIPKDLLESYWKIWLQRLQAYHISAV